MKILRIRRGFTTNSSASSEWVPPPWQQNALGFRQGPNAPGTSPSGSPLPGSTATASGPLGKSGPAAGDVGFGNLGANSVTLGLVLAGIAAAFATERLVRRLLRRNRREPESHDAG